MIWKKKEKEKSLLKKQLPGNKTTRNVYFTQEMESGNFGVLSQPSEMGDKMENGLKKD